MLPEGGVGISSYGGHASAPSTQTTSPEENNNQAPLFSFTALLTQNHLPEIMEQNDHINQIITTHAEQLRRTLAENCQNQYRTLRCAAEDRAGKRLAQVEKEFEKVVRRNAELEQTVAHYSEEAQAWQAKVKRLAESEASLKETLSRLVRRGGYMEPDDAESSSAEPDRVKPVNLACKKCRKRVATMMTWPCRHVSVCKECDANATQCVVCSAAVLQSTELRLS